MTLPTGVHGAAPGGSRACRPLKGLSLIGYAFPALPCRAFTFRRYAAGMRVLPEG